MDYRILKAALRTAWFFMFRAKEFTDSSGVDPDMIVRGVDMSLTTEGQQVKDQWAEKITLQFRKTKTDQNTFGIYKTILYTNIEYICVVQAIIIKFKEVVPRSFEGPEALLRLFRWTYGGGY